MKLNFNYVQEDRKTCRQANDLENSYLVSENLKVSSYLDPIKLNWDVGYTYHVRGASDVSGTPLKAHVTGYNAIKQRRKNRLRRVLSAHIGLKTAVLDVVCLKKHVKTP